jgi:hypothetical protein
MLQQLLASNTIPLQVCCNTSAPASQLALQQQEQQLKQAEGFM